jgi:hypothetical protein
MLVVHLPWLLCLAPIILKPIFLRAGMHPKHITSMFLLSIAWLSLLVLRPLLQLGVINSYLQPDQFSHQWGRKEDRVQWPTASLWRKWLTKLQGWDLGEIRFGLSSGGWQKMVPLWTWMSYSTSWWTAILVAEMKVSNLQKVGMGGNDHYLFSDSWVAVIQNKFNSCDIE